MNPTPPPLIEAHGLGKSYRLYPRHLDRLKEMLWLGRRRFSEEFWALRNVSLEVYRGDAWGIVGQNGAGKSTLLKLLCGVTLASEGQVRSAGRVSALLELGIGFHPEYTGRENLALSGALMGLGQDELAERLPAILEFADIGDFVDRPLKTYSSGMSVRLAFALATCVEPDVLVSDEILSVGDEAFQKKCIRWMEDFLSNGGTLLYCAHNAYQIKKLCGKAVWLDHGQVRLQGAASHVVQEYAEFIEAQGETNTDGTAARPVAALAAGENRITDVRLLNGHAQETSQFVFGQPFRARLRVEAGTGETKPPVVGVGLVRPDLVPVYGVASDMDGAVPRHVEGRVYQIDYVLPQLRLLPGRYVLRAHALDSAGLRVFDLVEREFSVRGERRELGLCYLPHSWET
ncbi:MAG: ABC transporter ATP-binding protein [Desulfurellaceae bacterium]|nr:ABC transporter ATP-binding protein [Desulfurellaceae bacterium]